MSDHMDEIAELRPEGTTSVRQGIGLDVKRLLRLRKVLMAVVFVVLVVPGLAGVWKLVPREHHATVDIQFMMNAPRVIADNRMAILQTYDAYMETQVMMLTGYPILSKVAANPKVQEAFNHRDDLLFHLAREVEVGKSPRRSEMVTISFRDRRRDVAHLVVCAIVDQYREVVREAATDVGGERLKVLHEERDASARLLDAQCDLIARRRDELGVPVEALADALPKQTGPIQEGLTQAEADLTTGRTRIRQAEAILAQLADLTERHRQRPTQQIFASGIEDWVTEDATVGLLREQLATSQHELAVAEDNYVATAPQLVVKRNERDVLASKLARVEAQVRGEALRTLVAQHTAEREGAETTAEDALERRDKFVRLLAEQRQDTMTISQGTVEILGLERERDYLQSQVDRFDREIFDIQVESRAPARAKILGEPIVSAMPDSTRRLRCMLVVLMAAATLAVACGILREATDQCVQSAADVAAVTRVPVLASIPDVSEDRLPKDADPARVAAEFPQSFTADELRRTVAPVLHAPQGGPHVGTCLVSSPGRGDGKTTLACNLACVLAQSGRSVLVVDTDAQTPQVEAYLGGGGGPGLSEVLAGTPLADCAGRAPGHRNLTVLGPGQRTETLGGKLASQQMADFLAQASEQFDHVILDTRAALLVSDARLLAPQVDGILLVAGVGGATLGMVRRCVGSLLEREGTRILGIVLNKMRHRYGGYLRRNVEAYYSRRPASGRDDYVVDEAPEDVEPPPALPVSAPEPEPWEPEPEPEPPPVASKSPAMIPSADEEPEWADEDLDVPVAGSPSDSFDEAATPDSEEWEPEPAAPEDDAPSWPAPKQGEDEDLDPLL